MNTLGLKLVCEDDFALEFEGSGVLLRITSVEKLIPQPFTDLDFKIAEMASHLKSLIEMVVIFDYYNSLEQDELYIGPFSSGVKIAWFKGPDGNLLSLTEYAN